MLVDKFGLCWCSAVTQAVKHYILIFTASALHKHDYHPPLLSRVFLGICLCSMLISLSNLSILLQKVQFSLLSLFWRPFCYQSNGKSNSNLSNLRLLHFGYCSNKLISKNWRKTIFIFKPHKEGGGGAKKPLNARNPLAVVKILWIVFYNCKKCKAWC